MKKLFFAAFLLLSFNLNAAVSGTGGGNSGIATSFTGQLSPTNYAAGLNADATTYLRGDGAWVTPAGGSGSTNIVDGIYTITVPNVIVKTNLTITNNVYVQGTNFVNYLVTTNYVASQATHATNADISVLATNAINATNFQGTTISMTGALNVGGKITGTNDLAIAGTISATEFDVGTLVLTNTLDGTNISGVVTNALYAGVATNVQNIESNIVAGTGITLSTNGGAITINSTASGGSTNLLDLGDGMMTLTNATSTKYVLFTNNSSGELEIWPQSGYVGIGKNPVCALDVLGKISASTYISAGGSVLSTFATTESPSQYAYGAYTTAATSGQKVRWSPSIALMGSAWNTNATAAANYLHFSEWAVPVSTINGSNTITGYLSRNVSVSATTTPSYTEYQRIYFNGVEALPTNYIASQFVPVPGFATFPMSNNIRYMVTETMTNVMVNNEP
jgi:hypothetical protein